MGGVLMRVNGHRGARCCYRVDGHPHPWSAYLAGGTRRHPAGQRCAADQRGSGPTAANAALALNLLRRQARGSLWLVPSPPAVTAGGAEKSLFSR